MIVSIQIMFYNEFIQDIIIKNTKIEKTHVVSFSSYWDESMAADFGHIKHI